MALGRIFRRHGILIVNFQPLPIFGSSRAKTLHKNWPILALFKSLYRHREKPHFALQSRLF
jgi:hypothetical protein